MCVHYVLCKHFFFLYFWRFIVLFIRRKLKLKRNQNYAKLKRKFFSFYSIIKRCVSIILKLCLLMSFLPAKRKEKRRKKKKREEKKQIENILCVTLCVKLLVCFKLILNWLNWRNSLLLKKSRQKPLREAKGFSTFIGVNHLKWLSLW